MMPTEMTVYAEKLVSNMSERMVRDVATFGWKLGSYEERCAVQDEAKRVEASLPVEPS